MSLKLLVERDEQVREVLTDKSGYPILKDGDLDLGSEINTYSLGIVPGGQRAREFYANVDITGLNGATPEHQRGCMGSMTNAIRATAEELGAAVAYLTAQSAGTMHDPELERRTLFYTSCEATFLSYK